MANIAQLLTEHMDIWTATETEKKSGRGRASGNGNSIYGVKKLRELILELAVRGKLVPQDPSDEPASQLLGRIQAEKVRLIAEGKLKKEKSLPPITDKGKPFELPEGWDWERFGNLVNISTGKLDANAAVDDGEYPFFTCSQRPSKIDSYSYDTKAVLLSGNGDFNVKFYEGKFDAYQRTYVIEPIYWDIKFCFILVSAQIGIITQNNRGSAIPYLKLGDLTTPLFAIPPLAEQHRIVAKVDELMALCDQLEQHHSNAQEAHETLVRQLLATLTQSQKAAEFNANWQRIYAHFDLLFTTEASIDALKQTLLQLAVMGKLVPQDPNDEHASELLKRIQAEKAKQIAEGKLKKEKPLAPIAEEEKPFELPQGWEWARLELLATLITKGSSPKWQGVNYTENSNDVLFVTSENVGSYSLLLETPKFVELKFNEIEPRSILQKGDYLMNIVGASIGRTAVFDRDDVANINQAVCLIRVVNSELSKAFLLRFFNSETCLGYMFDKQVDNARPNLSMGNIAKFLIPIPPVKEQHRIVAKVDALMALCDQLKTRLQQASQQQQTIADALVAQAVA